MGIHSPGKNQHPRGGVAESKLEGEELPTGLLDRRVFSKESSHFRVSVHLGLC